MKCSREKQTVFRNWNSLSKLMLDMNQILIITTTIMTMKTTTTTAMTMMMISHHYDKINDEGEGD